MAYILNIGHETSVLKARAEVLRHAGYAVVSTADLSQALILAREANAIILGATLGREEKRTLSTQLKSLSKAPVICLDGHPHDCTGIGDVILHSLDGPQLLLSALERVVGKQFATESQSEPNRQKS